MQHLTPCHTDLSGSHPDPLSFGCYHCVQEKGPDDGPGDGGGDGDLCVSALSLPAPFLLLE